MCSLEPRGHRWTWCGSARAGRDRAQPNSPAALCREHAWFKGSRVETRGPFPKADGKRAHPSQGEGRAQIVVEPKQELPFEIARGSQGGAAEGVAGNRHKTDWPSHFVKVRY